MKTRLVFLILFAAALVFGHSQFATADEVAKPSIQNPAGKPVPNLGAARTRAEMPRDCEGFGNKLYDLEADKSCFVSKGLKQIYFKRSIEAKSANENLKSWSVDSDNAEVHIRNMKILDFDSATVGMTVQEAREYCKKQGADLPDNSEAGALMDAGFFNLLKMSPSLKNQQVRFFTKSTNGTKPYTIDIKDSKFVAVDPNHKQSGNAAICVISDRVSK